MTDEEIYLKYRDELIRYATALVGPSDAEDVLSSVVTRLYRSKRSLGALEFPRPYLMKAVLHEALNWRRHWGDQPLGKVAVEPVQVNGSGGIARHRNSLAVQLLEHLDQGAPRFDGPHISAHMGAVGFLMCPPALTLQSLSVRVATSETSRCPMIRSMRP